MLMNNLSRWKGWCADLRVTIIAVSRSIFSSVVTIAEHPAHVRRRQIALERFCCREFTTSVFSEPQYIQTMSIYCHNAVNNASG